MALTQALVAVAKIGNLAGAVFADGKVGFGDVGIIIAGLGDLSGLGTIDFGGVLVDGKALSEAQKAEAVFAFKKAFDLPADGVEAGIEEAVDASLTALLALAKGQKALALLKAA